MRIRTLQRSKGRRIRHPTRYNDDDQDTSTKTSADSINWCKRSRHSLMSDGRVLAVADPIRANFVHLTGQECDRDGDLIERLKGWCDQELQERVGLLSTRKANGFIRECHGDMHLGNTVLVNDVIVIFDCIEFNEGGF